MVYDLGIDIGTTSTAAAVIRDGRVTPVRLGGTADVVPSVVSIRADGVALSGEPGERRALTDPARTAREFKRRFGDETPFILGGAPYSAATLTSFVLRDVLEQVVAVEGAPPRHVVLAHPASWGPFKLDFLQEAATNAGIVDAAFVVEPTAAAIEYAARAETPPAGTWLVYDFGGGTFDAALVAIDGSGQSAQGTLVGAPGGLSRLGGIDFDQVVLEFVDAAIGGAVSSLDMTAPDALATVGRLRQECRNAKEALSSDNEVEIPVILPSVHTSVRITRIEFENLIRARIAETNPVVDRLLEQASLSFETIAGVLLVGGTSRIPVVSQLIRDHTGIVPSTNVDPIMAVAAGAARLAARQSQIAGSGELLIGSAAALGGASGGHDATARTHTKRSRKVVGVGALLAIAVAAAAWATQSDGPQSTAPRRTPITPLQVSTTRTTGFTTTSDTTGSVPTISTAPTSSSNSNTTSKSSRSTNAVSTNTPRFNSATAPPTISCANHASTDRVDVGVAWNAVSADSVSVALDHTYDIWASNLPAQGSTTYSLPCDGSKVQSIVYFTAFRAGVPSTTTSRTITIVFS